MPGLRLRLLVVGLLVSAAPLLAQPVSDQLSPGLTLPELPAPEVDSSPEGAGPMGLVTVESDLQQADNVTGVVTASGNVRVLYPQRDLVATAREAKYFTKEERIVLEGDVDVFQQGGNRLIAERVSTVLQAVRDRGRRLTAMVDDEYAAAAAAAGRR